MSQGVRPQQIPAQIHVLPPKSTHSLVALAGQWFNWQANSRRRWAVVGGGRSISARPESGGGKNGGGKLNAFAIAADQAGAKPFG